MILGDAVLRKYRVWKVKCNRISVKSVIFLKNNKNILDFERTSAKCNRLYNQRVLYSSCKQQNGLQNKSVRSSPGSSPRNRWQQHHLDGRHDPLRDRTPRCSSRRAQGKKSLITENQQTSIQLIFIILISLQKLGPLPWGPSSFHPFIM